MSDGKWEREMLAVMAAKAGVKEHTFVLAWERTRIITRDRWLTDEAKALRIVQWFIDAGWTPPGVPTLAEAEADERDA